MIRVTQQANGQMAVSIPRSFAIALGLHEGDQVQWSISKAGNLELEKL